MSAGPTALADAVTLEDLEGEPYALLAELRERAPVAWVPALGGWLITRRDLALTAMRDPRTFTVQDPRFTTARVVGPSMLSLDGAEHARHRAPFTAPFRLGEVRARLAAAVDEEVRMLLRALEPRGEAELRREFAVFLVREGLLPRGKARQLAAMERLEFDDLLARRGVAWEGTAEEVFEDVGDARAALAEEPAR
jgi:cytochrome P450